MEVGKDNLEGHGLVVVVHLVNDRLVKLLGVMSHPHVIPQPVLLSSRSLVEPQVAVLTLVGQLACVDGGVLLQLTGVTESSVALRAVVV